MIPVLVTLAVVTGLCYGVREVARVYDRKWREERVASASALALREDRKTERAGERLVVERRKVMVLEREMTLRESQAQRPDASVVIPEDLQGRITAWEDDWAQGNERQTLLALFAEYQDWDVVRRKLTPLNRGTVDVLEAPREGMVQ